MATIYFQPQLDIPADLEATLIEISSAGDDNLVSKTDLEDSQKRWLIVGICLQSVIAPVLRQYAEHVVISLYQQVRTSDQIDVQTFSKYLKTYGPNNTKLNYETINNNKSIPWSHGKKNIIKYDYKVTNHVDFSKLFLVTSMAHYSAFDECDLSALLGMIINIDTFPQILQTVSKSIRSDVRNAWAHCNFDEWDTMQYQQSFQLMQQLIIHIQLNPVDEARLSSELRKWEVNGICFLQGYAIGQDVVACIRQHTYILIQYALKLKHSTEGNFAKVNDCLVKIAEEVSSASDRINRNDNQNKDAIDKIALLDVDVNRLNVITNQIENTQRTQAEQLNQSACKIDQISQTVHEHAAENVQTVRRITCLETEVQKTVTEVKNIQSDMNEFRQYLSNSRPRGKLFFYTPDRSEWFVGRQNELMFIEERFTQSSDAQCTQVICGLGGCGKTTLAIEFAWRLQQFYPGGVFWFSGESEETLEDSITDLAIDVNIIGKTTNETLKRTLKWLSNLTDRWLLVLDNADQQYISGSIKETLLGTWKRCSCGHIIITTRREQKEVEESLNVKAQFCISLDVFDVDESIEFVIKRTEKVVDEVEEQNIELLVNELGRLPLALEQASAHIKTIRCSFSDYIQRFQKKRLKLLKTARSTFMKSDKRLAVETTWQLNIDYISQQSENEGLGNAALTVMNVTSFLFADDIPTDIINIGMPIIEDIEIVDALDNGTGLKQVIEILTRFSLFQSVHADSLSVHRLVQEVIRNSMDENHKKTILHKAIRMVNCALNSTCSPYIVLYEEKKQIHRGSLLMWSKIAANANVLRGYFVHLTSDMKNEHGLFFNLETLNILQTTAVFQSLHQRQDRALSDQKQMLLIMTTLDIDSTDYHRLTSIKIPLFQQHRKRIHDSIATCITDKHSNNKQYNEASLLTHETLRTMGNEAFKSKKYQEALQYYTEAIRACSENNIDFKILSNRSLLYIRMKEYTKALEDANRCIEIDRNHWKAYCWKAYAIAGLIDEGLLQENMESVGLASACIAAFINKPCLLDYKMKINYPIINFRFVEPSANLGNELMLMIDRPYITLILKAGRYRIDKPFITAKSVQVIGLEDGVEIDTGNIFKVRLPPKNMFPTNTNLEHKLHAHFENVFFLSGGTQITVEGKAIASFYKCKFSNGRKGCDDFPKCKGEKGCINPKSCRLAFKAKSYAVMGHVGSGEVGHPGIEACNGGIAYLESCVLDRCGGGGVLADGDGSLIEIKNCTVRNMRQMGIESRNGGTIKATNNIIIENQFHGVLIGPRGIGFINGNTIQCNGQEGIYCCTEIDKSSTQCKINFESASKAVITDNIISQNGLCGLSFDGGVFEIKGNKIFDNWLWGLIMKLKSSCYILNNDIFENKCGGIYIGYNFSASVFIDGNTIRDHTGPDVYALNSALGDQTEENIKFHQQIFSSNDETVMYSRPPIITRTNVRRNNNKGLQHPRQVVDFITTCCFCREPSQKLKTCSRCKKATYCSKECQSKHWIRHKHMCKLLRESYIVEIKMKDTSPWFGEENTMFTLRWFDPRLKGIREGLPPDKNSSKPFIVKIQTGKEYSYNDEGKKLLLYDQSVTLDFFFVNPTVYHLANECGVLARSMFTTKKIFCWASFKNNGDILCIHTDNLPPFQTW